MEKLIQFFGIITPPLLYWLIDTIKSKNLSKRISDLKNEIEFTKGFNDELCSTLTHIYCAKTFQQQFGFEVVPSRVNAYLQCFNICDVSIKTFKYLYKKLYLKFDKATQKVNVIVTKKRQILSYTHQFYNNLRTCDFHNYTILFFRHK